MKSNETKQQFLKLRAEGRTFAYISEILNISKQTLINWSKDMKQELDNMRLIELETLQEEYYISKTQRIKLFGDKLKVLKAELEKRDLSYVSTLNLFKLLLKYDAILQDERIEIDVTKADDKTSKPKVDVKKVTKSIP